MKWLNDQRIAERIYLTDNGRHLGWDVLLDDRLIGTLHYHSYSDMFWVNYVLHSTVEDLDLRNDKFWDNSNLVYRSRANPKYCTSQVICRWSDEDSLIIARFLYVHPFDFGFFRRLRLCLRILFG